MLNLIINFSYRIILNEAQRSVAKTSLIDLVVRIEKNKITSGKTNKSEKEMKPDQQQAHEDKKMLIGKRKQTLKVFWIMSI